MKNTAINEKTLELNICEEYLVAIRKDHPNAYWYGPSTIEERDLGYDASMETRRASSSFSNSNVRSDTTGPRQRSIPTFSRFKHINIKSYAIFQPNSLARSNTRFRYLATWTNLKQWSRISAGRQTSINSKMHRISIGTSLNIRSRSTATMRIFTRRQNVCAVSTVGSCFLTSKSAIRPVGRFGLSILSRFTICL